MDHASQWTPESLLRHEEFVLRLARTLVRSDSDAEEIAQRTFASALNTPPRHTGLREWLARVTRNHATDLHRVERRRTDRERAVARNEAVDAGTSATERLELEHGVVRAVLSLDEPYRGVVVQTYYEGMTPAEIAEQHGIPAGTVRSQLTRAHEMLRGKLDRQHGERGTWMSALTGLLSLRDVQVAPVAPLAPAVSSAPTSLAWPIAIGAGVAACIATVLVVQSTDDKSAPRVESAAVTLSTSDSSVVLSDPDLGSAAIAAPTREPIEQVVATPAVAVATFSPAFEPRPLLEQSRQIKTLILDRRLTVSAEERERTGLPVDYETSGVVRMLDRSKFGDKFSLPWLREAGAYYSFTERVHDFNRRPQVCYQEGWISGTSDSLLLDLGARALSTVPTSAAIRCGGLSRESEIVWDAAWAPRENPRESLSDICRRIASAQDQLELAAPAQAILTPTRPIVGHSYLLRSLSLNDHDVTVAFEVVAKSADQCTLAWRLLESRVVADQRELWRPSMERAALPPAPEELTRLSETDLIAALEAVRATGERVILQSFSPEIEREFGSWRASVDRGLIRLTPYLSEWCELLPGRFGGSAYSFDERSYEFGYEQVGVDGDSLYPSLSGGGFGAVVDLGALSAGSVRIGDVSARGGPVGELVADHEFQHTNAAESGDERAARDEEYASSNSYRTRARELGVGDVRLRVGHTYALRSVRFGSHDVLVAVQVLAMDETGTVIAWRMLKRWPVTKRD